MLTTNYVLEASDAAKYLGFPKNALENLSLIGHGPFCFRLNETVYYPVNELDAWRNRKRAFRLANEHPLFHSQNNHAA